MRTNSVFIADNHAYLAAGTAGLQVLDVANEAAPSAVGAYFWPAMRKMSTLATTMPMSGGRTYIN